MTLPPAECKVYTPPLLAEAMVRAVGPHANDYWLDPCMGPGAFIAPLRRHGIPRDRIFGIDIDTSVSKEDGAATTVRGMDFFQWCARTRQRFTKIVANPPYVAICKLHPTLQQSLRDFGGEDDASFALRSNYWCAFLAASLRVLEQNGSLSFVLPATPLCGERQIRSPNAAHEASKVSLRTGYSSLVDGYADANLAESAGSEG